MRHRTVFWRLFFILGLSGFVFSQEQKLLPKEIFELLANEISGEEAWGTVVDLSGRPRIRPQDEYLGTFFEAEVMLERAKRYGLGNTKIEYFPWKYPCWEPIEAELWIVAPVKEKLTGLDLVQLCLMENSRSADVTADLVDVGEGTSPEDYLSTDVKRKIVLCRGDEGEANRLAVDGRGAAGLISYRSFYPDDRPDMVSWGGFQQPLYESREKYTFGFMLSPRQGRRLQELLREHKKIVVRAHVKARTHPGKLDVVSAVIQGAERPDEEIMLLAHLFEYYYKQGANDNASGSASILEAARVINKLAKERKIAVPRRSLRFFWEPEGWGTYAWLAKYPAASSRLKAVIDMDMVGESHQKCGSIFHLLETPDSLPHFFNDVVRHFLEYLGRRSSIGGRITTQSWAELVASPSGSRDPLYHDVIHFNPRMFNENWLSVPHHLFHCSPDPYYHSSEDTPDKCDPTQLKRTALLGAAAALFMANLEEKDIALLSSIVLSSAGERSAKDRAKALALLSGSAAEELHGNYKEALNIVRQGHLHDKGALASIGDYLRLPALETQKLKELLPRADFSSLKNTYAEQCRRFRLRPQEPSPSAEEKRLDGFIPRRLKGLEFSEDFLFLERALGDPDIKKKLSLYQMEGTIPWEALNFADGKRSLLEIRNALAAEFSPLAISLASVEDYFLTLEKAGVVKHDKRTRRPDGGF